MSSSISVAMSTDAPGDGEWKGLLSGALPEHGFLSREWYSAWGAAFLPMDRWDAPLRWLVARHSERGLAGIVPVAKQRVGGMVTHSLAGYYWPFRAPLINTELADVTARAIANWASVNGASVPWRFGPVPRGTPAVESLIAGFSGRGWFVMERRVGETYALAIQEPFEAYEKAVGDLIKKVSYYERRLSRSGSVEIRCESLRNDGLGRDLLQDLQSIEEHSWVAKQDDGKPKFLGQRNTAFWGRLAASRDGSLVRPMLLYLDGRPISYSLNIDAGNTRYIVANGYDEAFSSHSPGMVLAHHVLRDSAQNGLAIVEWGQGDSGYKSRWGATENLRLVDLLMLPRTTLGYIGTRLLHRTANYVRLR